MNYLSNAFSLNMLKGDVDFTLIRVRPINPEDIPTDVTSCIRHKGMARVIHEILGYSTKVNLADLVLEKEDILYVAQYQGTMIPKKGTSDLPEGAKFTFKEVSFRPNGCSNCKEDSCTDCEMRDWLKGRKI